MADNPYDAIADKVYGTAQDATVPDAPAPDANPYDAVFDKLQTERAQALKAGYIQASGSNPEEAARKRQVGSLLDKHPWGVDLEADGPVADMRSLDFDGIAQNHPAYADFLSDPAHMELAHKDVGIMRKIGETVFSSVTQTLEGVSGMAEGFFGKQAEQAKPILYNGQRLNAPQDDLIFKAAEELFANLKKYGHEKTAKSDEAMGDMGPLQTATWSGVRSMLSSVGTMLLTKSPSLGLLTGGATQGGLSVSKALDAGKTHTEAFDYGVRDMGTEIWTELSPTGKMAEGWKVGAPLVKTMMKELVADIPGEVSAQIMQSYNEFSTLHPEMTVREFGNTLPEQLRDTVIATLAGAGTAGTVMFMAKKGMTKAVEKQNREQIKADTELAAKSPLREQAPEVFKAALQTMHPDTEVYLPAEDGITFFQSLNDDDFNTIRDGVDNFDEKYKDAVDTGADMPISYPDYLTYIAKVDKGNSLASKLKTQAAEDDLLELFPELRHALPKEDPQGDAMEQRQLEEITKATGSVPQARNIATLLRRARESLIGDTKGNESFAKIVDDSLGAGLSVQKNPVPQSDAGIDMMIAKVKQRISNRSRARVDMLGDKIKKRGKTAPTPILSWLAEKGVVQGSLAAKRLKDVGVTPDTHPQVFYANGRVKGSLDVFPKSEFDTDMEHVGLVAGDDGNGYVDMEWLTEHIRDETFQKGKRTQEQIDRETFGEQLDDFEDHLRTLDIEPATATKAEIKQALARQGRTYNQSPADAEFKAKYLRNLHQILDPERGQKSVPMLNVCFTPPALQAVGLHAFPVMITANKLREATQGKHSVPVAELEKLPELLEDPVAVFKNTAGEQGEDRGFAVLIEAKDGNGNPVLVPINISKDGKTNVITTLYGRQDFNDWLKRQLKDNRLLYVRNKKSLAHLGDNSLAGGSSTNILTKDDIIKRFQNNQGNQGGENRAAVMFTPSGRTIVELFQQADKSSILHETGHIFLDILRRGASLPDAPANIKERWEKVNNWWAENHADVYREAKRYNPYRVIDKGGYHAVVFNGNELGAYDTAGQAKTAARELHKERIAELDTRGGTAYVRSFLASDRQAIDEVDQMILTAMDEQFARGFEAYLYEGKAPTADFRRLYATFMNWLKNIYSSVRALNVNLNDDVRDVFDRMVAGDEAVATARNSKIMKGDPAVMRMLSKQQREAYLRRKADLIDAARQTAITEALQDANRQTKEWWKSEETVIIKELEDKYAADPIYQALAHLKGGEQIDGLGPVKLSRNKITKQNGDIVKRLPNGIFGPDGLDAHEAAIVFNLPSADAFLEGMAKAAEPLEKRIRREARNEMVARHGDVFKDGMMEELATDHLMGSEAMAIVEDEIGAVTAEDPSIVMPPPRMFKAAAKREILNRSVGSARKPDRFLHAVLRAAKAATKALAGKKYEEFADAKRKQLFSMAMYRETQEFKRQHQRALNYFSSVQQKPKKSSSPAVNPEYRRMAVMVLNNFKETRNGVGVKLDVLKKFIADQAERESDNTMASYAGPTVESAFTKQSYDEMTVGEFKAIKGLVQTILKKGREAQTIMVDGKKRDFRELIGSLTDKLKAIPRKQQELFVKQGKMAQFFKSAVAVQVSTKNMMEIVDGGMTGLFDTAMLKGLDEAQGVEARMHSDAEKAIRSLYTSRYSPEELTDMQNENLMFAGQRISKMGKLMIGLNMGNDYNEETFLLGYNARAKALGHRAITNEDMQDLLDNFSERDFDFMQSVGDYLATYWPKIEALHLKRTGTDLERVEARPLQTHYGTYKGWYFPIVFDPDASVGSQTKDFVLGDEMKGMIGYASTSTARSHTIERVGNNKRNPQALRLDFSVITKHVSNVIHDLAMGEEISRVARIIRDPSFSSEWKNAFGNPSYDQLDLWLRDLAAGHMFHMDFISKYETWARRNAIIATMGFNPGTIITQVSGTVNSVQILSKSSVDGKQDLGMMQAGMWLGKGWQQISKAVGKGEYGDLMDMVHKKSSLMRDRAMTINRDVREAGNVWSKNPYDDNELRRVMMSPIGAVQKATVDNALWLAAYQKFHAENDTMPAADREKGAIRFADNAVIKGQSSGRQQDLSGLLRGTLSDKVRQSPLVKSVTFAFNYLNNKFNRLYTTHQMRDFSTMSGRWVWARDMMFLMWMDAFVTAFIKDQLRGMFRDKDDEPKDWPTFLKGWGWWLAQQPMSTVPFVDNAVNAFGDNRASDRVVQVVRDFASKTWKAGEAAVDPDKEMTREQKKMLLKSAVDAISFTTGLVPGVPVKRAIDILDRVMQGEDVEYKDFVRSRTQAEKRR